MKRESAFWDALAPHHAAVEENFLNRACLRRFMNKVRPPVLVVGAGQGLLVAELQSKGIQCDGVDFSPEMIRHAKSRRGLDLIQADASAMPMGNATYETIIYATGVIDFTIDENVIRNILVEGRRVMRPGGKIFVAFYRSSRVLEHFLTKLGLLNNHVLRQRECLKIYLLAPGQMLKWLRERAGVGWFSAAALMFRMAVSGTIREKITTLKMQRIIRGMKNPQAFVESAPEYLPYRNEAEIKKLIERMRVPLKDLRPLATCWVAQI